MLERRPDSPERGLAPALPPDVRAEDPAADPRHRAGRRRSRELALLKIPEPPAADPERGLPAGSLAIPPYLARLADLLRRRLASGWAHLAENPRSPAELAQARRSLLKESYRLEPEKHGGLFELAFIARAGLGLEALPLSLYQLERTGGELNAFLFFEKGELHIGLEGPLAERLTAPGELLAALAHEMGHYLLFADGGGEQQVARRLLDLLVADPRVAPAHFESWRLASLYREVFCDRAALAVVGAIEPVVATLVKVATGLAEVDGGAYCRQAAEICDPAAGRDGERSAGITHPETYLRAQALALWQQRGEAAEGEIARLIEGPPELENCCLVRQERFAEATRRLLLAFFGSSAFMRRELLMNHARLFFPEFPGMDAGEPVSRGGPPPRVAPLGDLPELVAASRDEGTRRYFAYLLLDLATADPEAGDASWAAAVVLAERLGIEASFSALAKRERGRGAKELRRLGEDCDALLAEADPEEAP